jgi:hemerythrin
VEQQPFPQWKFGYSVGNSTLDEQHKRLLHLCKQAVSCMADETKEGTRQFHDILNELAAYVDKHFRTEEALLRKCGYPLLDQHAEEHLEYQKKLTDFLWSATLGEINKAELHRYLSIWWSDHILGADKRYSSFIGDLGGPVQAPRHCETMGH